MACLFRYETVFASILCTFCFMILSVTNVKAQDNIRATEYPVDTSVIAGDHVTFMCTIVEPATDDQILDWFIEWDVDTQNVRRAGAQQNGAISATDRPEFTGRGSYTTTYSVSTAQDETKIHRCTLTITETTLRDNGFFGCTHQINPEDSHRTLLKQKIRLTVVPEPSSDPECTLNEVRGLYILTCVSTGGNPPANVTWFEGSQAQSESLTMINTIEQPGASISTERVFVCQAQQESLDPKTCSITLSPIITTSAKTTVMETEDYSSTIAITSQVMKIPQDKDDDNTGAIVGGVLAALLLLILILLLLLLLFIRKRRQRTAPAENPADVPLPDLEPPAETTVVENPYGPIAAGTTDVEVTLTDYDELEKPWKKNPELLMGVENEEFSDIELSDTNSATESCAAANVLDDQPYENYTAP